MERAAIFIDHENIRIRLGDLKPAKDIYKDDFIPKLKEYLYGMGVINQRIYAYDDFENNYFSNKNILAQYAAIGVKPMYSLNIKDAVDIELSLDAYEICLKEDYTTFIIVSSDKDMFPIIKKLKSKSKKVILMGITFNTSNYVIRHADNFIPIEEVVGITYDPDFKVKKDIITAVKRLKNLYNWSQGKVKNKDLGKDFYIQKLKEELFSTRDYAEEITGKLIANGIIEEYSYILNGSAYDGIKYHQTEEATNIEADKVPTFA